MYSSDHSCTLSCTQDTPSEGTGITRPVTPQQGPACAPCCILHPLPRCTVFFCLLLSENVGAVVDMQGEKKKGVGGAEQGTWQQARASSSLCPWPGPPTLTCYSGGGKCPKFPGHPPIPPRVSEPSGADPCGFGLLPAPALPTQRGGCFGPNALPFSAGCGLRQPWGHRRRFRVLDSLKSASTCGRYELKQVT